MFFFVKNLRVTQKYVHWPNNIHELHEERDFYDDVIMEQIPRYWLFVRGIHRWPVDSPHKGQWRGALICAWINVWTNNRNADDLRRHRDHYDVTVMLTSSTVVYPDGPLYMVPAILCHDMVISGFPAQRVSNAELTCCKPRYILKKKQSSGRRFETPRRSCDICIDIVIFVMWVYHMLICLYSSGQ